MVRSLCDIVVHMIWGASTPPLFATGAYIKKYTYYVKEYI